MSCKRVKIAVKGTKSALRRIAESLILAVLATVSGPSAAIARAVAAPTPMGFVFRTEHFLRLALFGRQPTRRRRARLSGEERDTNVLVRPPRRFQRDFP